MLLLLELPERLLDDDDELELLRGTLTVSALEDASWLLACSLPLCPVQPALVLPAAAEAPAAVALAMAPRPSKHPSSSEVARMAVKSPKA